MRKTFYIVVLSILTLSTADASRKSRAIARGMRDGAVLAGEISSRTQSGQNTQTSGGSTLQQSARDAMQNSQKGKGVATLMGVAFTGMAVKYGLNCAGSAGWNWYACGMTAVMVGMAHQSFGSARSFNEPIKTSWDNVCQFSSLGCSGLPPNPFIDPNDPKITNSQNDLNAVADKVRKGGFQVDAKTGKVTGPNGREIDPNDASSLEAAFGADGAKALGDAVSQAEKDALAKMEQVKSKYDAALGLDGMAGGAASIAVGDGYDVDDPAGAGGGMAAKRERNPAQAKGLSKNFNGDPIGVASDSIFEMMRRRYQLKTTQKTFFGQDVTN